MSIQSIMTQDQTGNELVTFAESTASQLVKDGLTRSQIRNIFTEVRKVEALWESGENEAAVRRLTMLKPKLDYQSARARHVNRLKDVLSQAIDLVVQAEGDERTRRFHLFVDLFESILAYHHSKGGRN